MSDYRVEIKVRNARIYRAMKAAGMYSIEQLEEILSCVKQAKQKQDEALKISMKVEK